MAILINKDSGLAENLADQESQQALQSDTHEVPLISPEGEQVSAPLSEVPNAMQQGYTKPTDKQFQKLNEYAKYSTLPEEAKTAAESAASAATFGLSTAAERALGVEPEAIRAREEVNPNIALGSEIGSYGAQLLTGVGEAKLIGQAGEAVGKKVAQLFGENALGRIGTTATKLGIENMMFQSGDEVHKMFASDPEQSAETAMANIGMAGAYGMLLGGASKGGQELWALGPGKQITKTLEMFKNRASGLPVELKSVAGLDIAPEVEAALGGTPEAKHMAALLMESSSKSGEAFQKAFGDFKEQAAKAASENLGHTPESLNALKDMSKHETGKEFQDGIVKAIEEKVGPIAKKYDEFNEVFKAAPIESEVKLDMQNKVANLISEQGLSKGPNESALKLANKVLAQLDSQATAQDLRAYIRGLDSVAPYGNENYQVAKGLKSILRGGEEASIEKAAAGSNVYNEFKATQQQYGQFKGLLEDMNDRLHLGREAKYGAQGFMSALKDMDPESVVNRLKLKDDVGLQNLLQQHFPEVNDLVKKQELDALLRKSLNKSGEGLDVKKLMKNIEGIAPELRQHLMSVEQLGKLESINKLVQQIPVKMNPSGTARTLDALWSKMPASAVAMASLMTGHNPVIGWLVGEMGHWAGREAPDAVRLAMLKFLGSNREVSAQGFKAAVQSASAAIKGEVKLTKAVKDVFKSNGYEKQLMSVDELERFNNTITKLSEDPSKLLQADDYTAHYLPDIAPMLSQAVTRNIAYLAALKPQISPLGVLDKQRVASSTEESKYNNALQIAQNPLLVLDRVKNGSLTIEDIQHLHAMYPALAKRMQSKLQEQMIDAVHDEQGISYKTKLSLSAFLGQPLEYSMQPQSIQASQPISRQPASQPNNGTAKPSQTGMKNLNKLPQSYSTPEQARELHKTKPH